MTDEAAPYDAVLMVHRTGGGILVLRTPAGLAWGTFRQRGRVTEVEKGRVHGIIESMQRCRLRVDVRYSAGTEPEAPVRPVLRP